MEERHLSLTEVAGLMGVSERTVRRWIKSGKLRAYKPGRDYRISESSFRAFVEESEINPKGRAPSSRQPSFNDVLDEDFDRWLEGASRQEIHKTLVELHKAAPMATGEERNRILNRAMKALYSLGPFTEWKDLRRRTPSAEEGREAG